ncbi:dihydrodipicolinate reductase C-terminal domain-containing protein [Streptomyces sp. DT24]|uniref:dihydrodipicolinate reductase C-terminal domain-containing protein n=1 Tax=unclassified Streptomyces TaxID=2593676 RepID=UPI003CFA7789
MSEPTIGVVGVGRLGGAIAGWCAAEGLTVREFNARRPAEWGGIPVPDVFIDCSAREVVDDVLDLCERLVVPLVECVSDLTPGHHERLRKLAQRTVVVPATNLSLGNYLLTRVVEQVAGVLRTMDQNGIAGAMPEASVCERHPATKSHRPSGTAAALATCWLENAGSPASDVASLRAGGPVSDHEIRLSWAEQTLTVRHEMHTLDSAASGAVGIAGWTIGRSPGLYSAHTVFDHVLESMNNHAPGNSERNGADR